MKELTSKQLQDMSYEVASAVQSALSIIGGIDSMKAYEYVESREFTDRAERNIRNLRSKGNTQRQVIHTVITVSMIYANVHFKG